MLSYIKKTLSQEHLSNNIWEKESLILSFLTTFAHYKALVNLLSLFKNSPPPPHPHPTPPPPHPHPPKQKKNDRERLLLSTFYSMIKLCCLNRQQPLSFFCSMFHTLLRSKHTHIFYDTLTSRHLQYPLFCQSIYHSEYFSSCFPFP